MESNKQRLEKKAEDFYINSLKNIILPVLGNDTTFGDDLLKIGTKMFGTKFKGIFASDKIPKLNLLQPYAIINLDKSSLPGSHWVGVAKSRHGTMLYDSFGRSSKSILPSLHLSSNGRIVSTDRDVEQKDNQNNCGQRVLAWLNVFDKLGADLAILV